MVKIAPSILAADFSRLGKEIERVENAGAEMLHIDVMDGHFVPNLSIGPIVVQSIRSGSHLLFDAHLMVEEPGPFVSPFAEAGVDCITLHADNPHRLYPTIRHIKSLGKKVGVAFCPLTPLEVLEYLLHDVDVVLQMTVEPGFGGQPFMDFITPKIRKIRHMIDSRGLDVEVAVDGGINERTAPQVIKAGADILVMGSAVFAQKNDLELREMFKRILQLRRS